MSATFTLHFDSEPFLLRRTEFTIEGKRFVCVQGQDAGCHEGAGSFQWCACVRAVAILFLRYASWARRGKPGEWPVLSMPRPSPCSSLFDVLKKQAPPSWVRDMFGEPHGLIRLQGLIKARAARNGKGRIEVYLDRQSGLAPNDIKVYLDDQPVTESTKCDEMAKRIHESEDHWSPVTDGVSIHVPEPKDATYASSGEAMNDLAETFPAAEELLYVGYSGRWFFEDLRRLAGIWSVKEVRILLNDLLATDSTQGGSLPPGWFALKQSQQPSVLFELLIGA